MGIFRLASLLNIALFACRQCSNEIVFNIHGIDIGRQIFRPNMNEWTKYSPRDGFLKKIQHLSGILIYLLFYVLEDESYFFLGGGVCLEVEA